MATSSEVKAGLDDIAQSIRTERQAMANAKARIATGEGNLNLIPTTFSDVLSTINGFSSSTTDEFEALCKAELAKMTTEFTALKTDAGTAKTALSTITEF